MFHQLEDTTSEGATFTVGENEPCNLPAKEIEIDRRFGKLFKSAAKGKRHHCMVERPGAIAVGDKIIFVPTAPVASRYVK